MVDVSPFLAFGRFGRDSFGISLGMDSPGELRGMVIMDDTEYYLMDYGMHPCHAAISFIVSSMLPCEDSR